MDEYITRNNAISAVCFGCNQQFSDEPCEPSECSIRQSIMALPTADVAEVVRCKDCKFWTPMDDGISWQNKGRTDGECQFLWQLHHAERHLTEKDHFCGYGERKE